MNKPPVHTHSNIPYKRYTTSKYDEHTEVLRAKDKDSYISNNDGNTGHTYMIGVGDNDYPFIQTGVDINHLAVDSDTEKPPPLIINENKYTE